MKKTHFPYFGGTLGPPRTFFIEEGIVGLDWWKLSVLWMEAESQSSGLTRDRVDVNGHWSIYTKVDVISTRYGELH